MIKIKRPFFIFAPFIFIILILIIIISIYLYGSNLFDYSEIELYEMRWDIDIPADFEIIIGENTTNGFNGEGNRYTIFTLGDTNFFDSFQKTFDKDIIYQIMQEVNKMSLSTEQREYLSFSDLYEAYKFNGNNGSWLIILYYPIKQYCIFIENLN